MREHREIVAHRRLWQAVILRSINDLKHSCHAWRKDACRLFFSEKEEDVEHLQWICEAARMNWEDLRRNARKIYHRQRVKERQK